MKKNFISVICCAFVMAVTSLPLMADSALVTYVNGKVEVNRNNQWISLKAGDTVNESEVVSTGFNSEAKIKYGGSLMAIGPLTRITITELKSTSSSQKVDVYLNTGAVRSKVQHTDVSRVSYKVRGPVSVASVRGTTFDSFADGDVVCYEGAVVVYPAKAEAVKASKASKEKKAKKAEAGEETEETEQAEELEEAPAAVETTDSSADEEYEAATATTPAEEISDDAPKGAHVVGAGQKTTASADGSMEKPADIAKKEAAKPSSGVATAAEADAASTDVNTGSNEEAGSNYGQFIFQLEIIE